MDFNPFNSSLFTGAGTPWGAKRGGAPDYTSFNSDVNAYQGFDSSDLAKAMRRRLMQQGAATQAQAMAALRKQGIKGADTSRALMDLAAQQEQGLGDIEAQMKLQDYASRERAMALAQNQFNRQQDWNALQSQQEDASRAGLWGNLFNTGAQVGGSILGDYLGTKWVGSATDPNKPLKKTYGPFNTRG